jgi:HK97 family phage major capsid protein
METNQILEKVLGEINKVGEGTNSNATEITELKIKAAKLEGDIKLIEEKAAADLAVVRATLKGGYGATGAEDWANEFGKFIRGAHLESKGRKSDETFKNGERVADVMKAGSADFTTTTGATAGYLIPTLLRPGFVELKDIYGNLYPRVTKFTSPPGQSVVVNDQSANPVAAWISGQNAAMTQEPTPRAYNDDTLVPKLLYVYELMANELVNNPYVSFAAMSAVEGAKAVTRKLEYDMLAAASSPHAGVVAASTAQTTMASATFALIGAFIKEAIADNAYAINPTNNCLFLHPRDAITLALQAVGASELTGMLVWGDPRRGVPTTLLGYEVVIHPGCNNGTNNYAFLGDPKNIILAEAPSYMIDFSDQVGFAKFQTAMRVGSHYDYIVKQTSEWHRAIVTA